MSDFSELTRVVLQARGYSLRGAARALNYDVAYLSRVLSGKQQPSPQLAEALDNLLDAGGALAGLVLEPEESDRLAYTAAHPSRVDAGSVAALAGLLAAYRRLDDSMPPEFILPAALVQMRGVLQRLRGARGPHRRQLMAVASEFVQFGGWMLAQQRRDDKAVGLLEEAQHLAEVAGEGTLVAQALNFRGYVARQQDDHRGVARWFSAAAQAPGAHPAQRLGDVLQAAAGLAGAGERIKAERAVDTAERLWDSAVALPPPDTAYWLTPEFNRLNMGLFTLSLGRFDEAVDHFTSGLAGLPPEQQGADWTSEHRAALKRAQAGC